VIDSLFFVALCNVKSKDGSQEPFFIWNISSAIRRSTVVFSSAADSWEEAI